MNFKKAINKDSLTRVGGLTAGSIGANLLVSKIPVGSDKVKNGIGIFLGLMLGGQKGIMGHIGNGMIAGCGANLAKSFGIGGPTIIGEVEDVIIGNLQEPDSTDERNEY